MLFPSRRAWAAGAALALSLFPLSCSKSDMATNPVMSSPVAASVNVAGTWTGSFMQEGKAGSSTVTATLEQSGSQVHGVFESQACGIRGEFIGTLSGNSLSGKVEMSGCKSGAVVGTASASSLQMSVGNFLSLSDFADKIMIYGGDASLHR